MKTFLIALNPGAAQKASVERLASLQKERESQDKQLHKLRKYALQKKKEYMNLMEKVGALEVTKGRITDQLREVRKVIGGLESDTDGEQMDVYINKEEDVDLLEDGSEQEGLAGATDERVVGKPFLRRDYGDLYGPRKPRGQRVGPYIEGGDLETTPNTQGGEEEFS